jgi:hypothetical protein
MGKGSVVLAVRLVGVALLVVVAIGLLEQKAIGEWLPNRWFHGSVIVVSAISVRLLTFSLPLLRRAAISFVGPLVFCAGIYLALTKGEAPGPEPLGFYIVLFVTPLVVLSMAISVLPLSDAESGRKLAE